MNMSLALESDSTIRVYYTYKENVGAGRFAYYVDDVKTSIIRTTSGKCYLAVQNISAKDLDGAHTFAISLGGKTLTLKASGLTYAYIIAQTGKEKDVNLAKAMYLYNKTAEEYFTK